MKISTEQRAGLRVARLLIEWGVPVFRARPDLDEAGIWRSSGGHQGTGYWLPKRWEQTAPDQGVIDAWRPGDALCAVTGVLVDVIDVDPHKGGSESFGWLLAEGLMPRSWGRVATASGGTHDYVATLGVASWNDLLGKPGLDLKAGKPDGSGRGFVFLPPTVKLSKVTGEPVEYRWLDDEPDLDELVIVGADHTGDALTERVSGARGVRTGGDEYDGPDHADLASGLQDLARAEVERQTEQWREWWAEAVDMPEGATNARGKGWEALATEWAWTVANLVASRWSSLDEDDGEMLHDVVLPPEVAADRKCRGKWTGGLVAKAPGLPAPWSAEFAAGGGGSGGGSSAGTGQSGGRPAVDVTNPATALEWLQSAIGTGPLSGMFRRDDGVVFTPRIGEEGYLPGREGERLGPAQVRRLNAQELSGRIDITHRVFKRLRVTSTKITPCLFPAEVAGRALQMPDALPNLRWLWGVTHTPVIRPDGSLLSTPGYDPATGVLYLPEPGLDIPGVPDRPTGRQVDQATGLIQEMLVDFPFVTPVDKANYIGGALFTPLLRSMLPPPYKIVALGAPQAGSGKSLLASVSRGLHGGVFKSEFPHPEEEVRKFVTTVLAHTTAPVVQFDNVSGVLRSSTLEGLLTSASWSDRRLGETEMISMSNDRLWMLTGNNMRIAGDLARRVLWSWIDYRAPHPELRTGFHIEELEMWVAEHRGELLCALLTIVRAWSVAGRPVGPKVESSGYGTWLTGLRGIVDSAGFDATVGSLGGVTERAEEVDRGALELAALLIAVARVFGSERWTAGDLLDKVDRFETGEKIATGTIGMGELPESVAEKFERTGSETVARRALGNWLDAHQGRWADNLSICKAGANRTHTALWRLEGSQ